MGKSKADERPYWTLEEFQKFSDAIMDKQDSWIAFQILSWTGMRIGELLALQVKDIDFEQGTITVDESLTRLDGEDLITAPKTESSVRVILIDVDKLWHNGINAGLFNVTLFSRYCSETWSSSASIEMV